MRKGEVGPSVSRWDALHMCPSSMFKTTPSGGITQFCRRNSSSYQLHTSSNLFWGRTPGQWAGVLTSSLPCSKWCQLPWSGWALPTPIFPLSQLTQHTAARPFHQEGNGFNTSIFGKGSPCCGISGEAQIARSHKLELRLFSNLAKTFYNCCFLKNSAENGSPIYIHIHKMST